MIKKIVSNIAVFLERISNMQLWIFVAVVGLFYGLAVIIATPPLMGPDENVHFFAVHNLMRGNMSFYIPESLKNMSSPNGEFFAKPSQKYSKELWQHVSNSRPVPNEKEIVTAVAYRNFIAYMPFVAVGKICNVFSDRYLVCLYSCRVIGLLIYLLLAAYAVKIIPVGKLPLTFLVLMPQSVFMASMLNSDYITFGSLILFTAFFVRECLKDKPEEITFKSPLFWSGILLGAAKFPVPLFVLLILFLPWSVLKKSWKVSMVLLGCGMILSLLQVCSLGDIPSPDMMDYYDPHHIKVFDELGPKLSLSEKVSQFALRCKNTLFSISQVGFLGLSFVGFLCYFCTLIHPSILLVYVGFMLASMFTKSAEKVLKARYVLGMTLAAFGGIFVILVSFYLINCRYDHSVIRGLQGRYFIPPVVLLIMAFAERTSIFNRESERKYFRLLAMLVILVVAVAAVVSLYQRFYSSFYFDSYR